MTLVDLPDSHDLGHLDVALRHVQQFRTALDGGAHRGIWTGVMAARFRRVVAVEPVAMNADLMPPLENVTAIRAALGAHAGAVGMAPGRENTGQWHVCEGHDVPLITIDSLGIADLDFLKLDVEGFELPALKGATETIGRCRPVVMIEENGLCGRYGVARHWAGEFLAGLGMRHATVVNKDHIYVW